MNIFITILQILSAIIAIAFIAKAWNSETQTYDKDLLKGAIYAGVFFVVLMYFKKPDVEAETQIRNIEQANGLLLNKSKQEVIKLIGQPDYESSMDNYYEYDSSKRGVFYQLDAADHGKELKVYFDEEGNCNLNLIE